MRASGCRRVPSASRLDRLRANPARCKCGKVRAGTGHGAEPGRARPDIDIAAPVPNKPDAARIASGLVRPNSPPENLPDDDWNFFSADQ